MSRIIDRLRKLEKKVCCGSNSISTPLPYTHALYRLNYTMSGEQSVIEVFNNTGETFTFTESIPTEIKIESTNNNFVLTSIITSGSIFTSESITPYYEHIVRTLYFLKSDQTTVLPQSALIELRYY